MQAVMLLLLLLHEGRVLVQGECVVAVVPDVGKGCSADEGVVLGALVV